MSSDNETAIRLVLYQPDPERQKSYAAVVLSNEIVKGEWFTQERRIPTNELSAFKEKFRRTGAQHGFEYSENPPLVLTPNT